MRKPTFVLARRAAERRARRVIPTCGYRKSHPAGADAVMGYSRFGMIDLLKLLGGLLVGLFRSRAARDGISPPAACCPAAVRTGEAPAAHCRSLDLRLALSAVPLLARSRGCLQARDAGALASERVPSVLALEIAPSCWPACGPR